MTLGKFRIPLVLPALPMLEEIEADIRRMLDSGRLTNFGPFSEQLEQQAATAFETRHAAAVSNATTGLCLVLNTLPRGSEVILPSFTFVATVQAVLWNGLVPVFADIDPLTLNLDPASAQEAITEHTSAILAVHAFGVPCEAYQLQITAARHGLALFFDAAHACGSTYKGHPVGGFGDAEVFSLSATKVIPSGEGGLVTTNNSILYRQILDRRNYGLRSDGSRDCNNWGLNGKLPEFAAILALKEIGSLSERIEKRNQIARAYTSSLRSFAGLTFQHVPDDCLSTYKDYTIQMDADLLGVDRDQMRRGLAQLGIETAPYFWPPVHQMSLFQSVRSMPLPNTEKASARILSLPLFESLSSHDQRYVIESIASIVRSSRDLSADRGIEAAPSSNANRLRNDRGSTA